MIDRGPPHAFTYAIEPAWRAALTDLGVDEGAVLRRAELPDDLFARTNARLDSAGYYRLWRAMEVEVDDPAFPYKLHAVLRTEPFSPPLFAALCSPNLLVAVRRIARYKTLVGPVRLTVDEDEASMTLAIRWLDVSEVPPDSFVAAELGFFVQLARTGTRSHVVPLEVLAACPLRPEDEARRYFGVSPRHADGFWLRFTRGDALAPFLTANDADWSIFAPELRLRLADLAPGATVAQRVQAVLHEALPSGQANMEAVSRRLAMSKRTLQRRLTEEGTTFQGVLQRTREAVARHYLTCTTLGAGEISFLLGFEEPNSFYRAFRDWTGQTPETVRRGLPVN